MIIPPPTPRWNMTASALSRAGHRQLSRFMIEHTDLSDDENFMKFLDMLRQTIGASITSLDDQTGSRDDGYVGGNLLGRYQGQ